MIGKILLILFAVVSKNFCLSFRFWRFLFEDSIWFGLVTFEEVISLVLLEVVEDSALEIVLLSLDEVVEDSAFEVVLLSLDEVVEDSAFEVVLLSLDEVVEDSAFEVVLLSLDKVVKSSLLSAVTSELLISVVSVLSFAILYVEFSLANTWKGVAIKSWDINITADASFKDFSFDLPLFFSLIVFSIKNYDKYFQ